ncbi:MAG: pyridinium-3,5-biscarboxylic acid mononucleotide synthase [Solirubrobacteraceae bacterium]|jgi:NCAIR mutase (PurE)-related protein|nr:pyridinium-3,5-biscarboxylic acid mononucleotide synthase [Solirubrobacteraceae bacterium]
MSGDQPILDLGFARLDTERGVRQGVPEVVLAEGKTAAQVGAIVAGLVERGSETVIVTRADPAARAAAHAAVDGLEEDADAEMVWLRRGVPAPAGTVAIVSAGTSDGRVVREVQRCCELLGTNVTVQEDVGVAGLHRLAVALPDLRAADCVVVAAGQDAALASVVGGLVATPVIAVPTSVGYGVAAGGQVALMSMLCSCAPGVAVVNIDDGFGAATVASRIARAAAS